MKKGILLIIFVIFQFIQLQAQESVELNWITDFDNAKALAKQENKPILIFFTGSDWCGLCKMLKKDYFKTTKFKELASKNLILYKADFPRRTDIVTPAQKLVNEALDKKYSKTRGVRVFPTIVMIDASGKEISFIESYNYIHDTSRHSKLIDYVLTKYN